jgi:hypothetical protein
MKPEGALNIARQVVQEGEARAEKTEAEKLQEKQHDLGKRIKALIDMYPDNDPTQDYTISSLGIKFAAGGMEGAYREVFVVAEVYRDKTEQELRNRAKLSYFTKAGSVLGEDVLTLNIVGGDTIHVLPMDAADEILPTPYMLSLGDLSVEETRLAWEQMTNIEESLGFISENFASSNVTV